MYSAFLLFLGSFADSLIGPNLFVPGEPFLLAAGYQLHSGAWLAVVAVLLGGLLGDQLSYAIGGKIGRKAEKRLLKWQPKLRRIMARARVLIRQYPIRILLFARLFGPVAWVVPFIAGRHGIRWSLFTRYSSIGLLLGVGQFVVWGYLIAMGLDKIPFLSFAQQFLHEYKLSLLLLLSVIVFYWQGRKRAWRRIKFKSCLLLLIGLLLVNYSHFFLLSRSSVESNHPISTQPVSLNSIQFKAFPGRSLFFKAQAVNVVFKGESPTEMMQELGWVRNKTFSRDQIRLRDYIALLRSQTPPVSDLYLHGSPQHLAFQKPGNLLQRLHIRWWHLGTDKDGQTLWAGAISYDDGLALKLYSGIVTILHSIHVNVDQQRDELAFAIEKVGEWQIALNSLADPISLDSKHDYFSDGQVLIIEPSMQTAQLTEL